MSAAEKYEAEAQPAAKPAPRRLVWDLETVSGWDDLPEELPALHLAKYAAADLRLPLECRGNPANDPHVMAAVTPVTAQIIVGALWDPDGKTGRCYYVGDTSLAVLPRRDFQYFPVATERDLIASLWQVFGRYPDAQKIGFNSRGFDAMMMKQRSMKLRLKATVNLLPPRYDTTKVLDLYDVIGGFGAGRCPSLDILARTLGIPSPKQEMSGADVQRYWDAGRVLEIADYCCADVLTTAAVAEIYEETLGDVYPEKKARRW